jgi:hypothetical protein
VPSRTAITTALTVLTHSDSTAATLPRLSQTGRLGGRLRALEGPANASNLDSLCLPWFDFFAPKALRAALSRLAGLAGCFLREALREAARSCARVSGFAQPVTAIGAS